MMFRLSLATRTSLIVVVALLVVWLGSLAAYYRSHDWEGRTARPSPHQILALVEAIEQARPAERGLILDAVSSDLFAAKVEPGGMLAEADAWRPASEKIRKEYAAALGGREFSLAVMRGRARRHRQFLLLNPKMYQFRVRLKTGEVLVIITGTPLFATRFGLPVGFGAGLFGTLVALLALVLMNRQMRPLSRLAAAVDKIDLSNGPVPLPQMRTSAPEITALVAAFGRLQQRLAQLLAARMTMLGGISHDVRTFATRLRLRVERIPEPEERERAIDDISDMIRLLDDALLASRAGAGELGEELLEFDRLIGAECEDRRKAGADISLDVAAEARGAAVLGDRLALRRVIANLIDNALHYGHAAHLRLARDGKMLVLTIDDAGPGIPAERRTMLFEPFVRLETSRNRRTGGAGLGLAIVRNLVEAHGGTVAIEDAPTGGARVIFRLPAFADPSKNI